jgi:hypothetical protein
VTVLITGFSTQITGNINTAESDANLSTEEQSIVGLSATMWALFILLIFVGAAMAILKFAL